MPPTTDRIYLGAFNYPPADTADTTYFTIDDALPYNSFHHDFGPLHVGHLYRFAVTLHEILAEEENEGKSVVLYSRTDSRSRANAACILCCYMVLIQSWPPHLALAPITQAEPPFMPFRDAGYAPADFVLTIQDIVYGVWKAKENKLLELKSFNLEEYELYERVDQGDFNEIPPHFVAFASPQQQLDDDYDDTPLNYPFCQVLDYFKNNNVQLVVRLNSELYNAKEFESRGVKHIDLIFDDGTCPTMPFVQKFIGAAQTIISNGGKIAVHCKAGLGRTGCLIGAYLIYTYGFTAQEVIGYMRFLRPGMVVGPQQHWLYLHQHEFREWKYTMTQSKIPDNEILKGLYPLVSINSVEAKTSTTPSKKSPPKTPERSILTEVENKTNNSSALPVPTPGQPRKYSPSPATRNDNNSPTKQETNSDNEDDDNINKDQENNQPIIIEKIPKRNITDSLSQKQQMYMGRQLRTVSNPNTMSSSKMKSNRNSSYQFMTTTTTTTTTTTVTSDPTSPQHNSNAICVTGDNSPLRRSTRISSKPTGVRKVSNSAKR